MLIKIVRKLVLLLCLPLLTACATLDGPPDPDDPFESYNRGMYRFNDAVDRNVIKPVAEGYVKVTPGFLRTGVSNFFSNLDDVLVIINDVLQLKLAQAASDISRLLVNSTVGLFGLVDVATPIGLEKHNEDFGQTLGYWGVGSGPFVVLPFFGPSSPRDGLGLYLETTEFDLVDRHVDDNRDRNLLTATRIVNTRARLLSAGRILDTAALDPYAFMRDAYLQRRRNLVYDGNPPPVDFDEPAGPTGLEMPQPDD